MKNLKHGPEKWYDQEGRLEKMVVYDKGIQQD
ncbi:MAG: hypothetical protein L3J31_03705 [Bacteroidales bacterium]|nr:hypothetical protein [Bacteroidales bacterium]